MLFVIASAAAVACGSGQDPQRRSFELHYADAALIVAIEGAGAGALSFLRTPAGGEIAAAEVNDDGTLGRVVAPSRSFSADEEILLRALRGDRDAGWGEAALPFEPGGAGSSFSAVEQAAIRNLAGIGLARPRRTAVVDPGGGGNCPYCYTTYTTVTCYRCWPNGFCGPTGGIWRETTCCDCAGSCRLAAASLTCF
jgi:hypothetical protein